MMCGVSMVFQGHCGFSGVSIVMHRTSVATQAQRLCFI